MAVAVAAAAAAVDRKKSVFRKVLTALRYAVTAAVTPGSVLQVDTEANFNVFIVYATVIYI